MPLPKTDPDLHLDPNETQALRLPPLFVESYGATDQGRVRSSNEDCFLIAELARSLCVHQANFSQQKMQYSQCRGHVFIVADGMGGHQAGEVASALSVELVGDYLLNTLRGFCTLKGSEEQQVLRDFQSAIRQADDRIIDESLRRPELSGMGTTLTLAFVHERSLFIAHVGDSRCYLMQDGYLQQITHDHNMAAEMVRRGMLKPREAASSRLRHVITNVLGGADPGVKVEMHSLRLDPGDSLLLCSDGLCGMIDDDTIATILEEEADPADACARLIAAANEQGGKDNITAIVVRFRD
ncbi:MAG: Stp1/IreP family PP2C-type Ser/Thr phosphatase [Gemmataceae bacterium]